MVNFVGCLAEGNFEIVFIIERGMTSIGELLPIKTALNAISL